MKNLNCSLMKAEMAFYIKCRYLLMLFVCSALSIIIGNQKLDDMDFHIIHSWHLSSLYIHAWNHLLTFVDAQAFLWFCHIYFTALVAFTTCPDNTESGTQ